MDDNWYPHSYCRNLRRFGRIALQKEHQYQGFGTIDDVKGHTLASASSLDKDVKGNGGNVDAAAAVGKLVAERAVKAGVKEVVFDRGPFLFHGRVKAVADAAREGGLSF